MTWPHVGGVCSMITGSKGYRGSSGYDGHRQGGRGEGSPPMVVYT